MVLSWIGIALLYLLAMGLLRWLGGISAAADAISGWGCATADRRRGVVSSSA
jgi:hypothetical protein